MIFIIGGSYQGKLDYAKEKYHLNENDICDLKNESIDLNKKCLYHLEEYIYNNTQNNISSLEYFKENINKLKDKILIMNDIFCGVVPIDKMRRLSREEAGRVSCLLSENAETVIRIYLGLEEKLK